MIFITEHKKTKYEGKQIEANSLEEAICKCSIRYSDYIVLGKLIKEIEVTDIYQNN